jgi:hypothetical protein
MGMTLVMAIAMVMVMVMAIVMVVVTRAAKALRNVGACGIGRVEGTRQIE